MATNWPPAAGSYPPWPPAEIACAGVMEFSDIQTAIIILQAMGFTRANPTSQENQAFFRGVRCDEGHPCSGIIIISPQGVRYPFAYCTGATHKSALVLWDVSHGTVSGGSYDLGWGSGAFTP